RELLQLVGLEGYENRKVHELSGGEALRIAFARAIAAEPRILLLDEPLSALDAPLRKRIRTIIRQIHEKTGTPMLYVTHDREEAFAIADRILVMKAGRIEAIGKPEELYRNPPNLFVATFTGEGSTVPMSLFEDDDEERTAFIRPEDIRIVNQTERESNRGIVLNGAEVLQTEFNGTSYTVNLNYDGFPLLALSDTRPEEKTVSLSISKNAIHQFSAMIRH
ncbi:MAG: ABC transporter ATP-binding protein, partial [Spirochaetales bacterium]|nr:ABC transporter ATP-binding protein [Spirochaetales bacterium]